MFPFPCFTTPIAVVTAVPHRYWRINITAVNGNLTSVSLANLELYTAIPGANIASGGTASASSVFAGIYVASLAFNSQLNDFWNSAAGAPQWLAYDFGAGNEKAIVSVGLHGRDGPAADQMPKDFDVQYSDNGSTWTTEWSVTNQTSWIPGQFRKFDKPGAPVTSYTGSPWGSHSYWAIWNFETSGAEGVIADMEYLATPGGSDQCSGGTASGTAILGSFPAANAFDNNIATQMAWSNGAIGGLVYQFTSPVEVSTVTVTRRNDGISGYDPKNFLFMFADSAAGPWTTTFSRTSETGWTNG